MSIHGGTVPGSRGCIDLVNNMGKFVALFKGYGRDMNLEVKYPDKYKLIEYRQPWTLSDND